MRYKTVPLKSIKVGKRFRKDLGDIPSLMASIKLRGQLVPIIVDEDMNLIAGMRRMTAIHDLGWKEIEVKVIDISDVDALVVENDENEIRKEFTVSERVAIAKAIEEKFAGQKFDRANRRDGLASEVAGFGNRETYRQASTVVAQAVPEVIEAMDSGILSISDAAKVSDEKAVLQRAAVKDVVNGKANTASEALRERNSQRDRTGQLWPRHVLPAIEASRELNEFRVTVAKLVETAKHLSEGPMNTHIDWTPIADSLEKIRKTCLNGAPTHRCPYCDGSGKVGERVSCKPCKGNGWVTAKIWANSPSGQDDGAED